MITIAKSAFSGDASNLLVPDSFIQIYPSGSNYIGIEKSDALTYPLAAGVTSAPSPVLTNIWNGSFTFTEDFFGTMAFTPNTYPDGIVQGVWRTHDSFTRWADIETSEGVYNPVNLGYLDYIVNTAFNVGAEVMYTVYKTPAWAAVGGNVNAPPSSATYLTNWINFLYARYGTKIKYYEGWNEPNIVNSFVGNIAALVTHQQTFHNAVKANNASLVTLSPSFGMSSGISTAALSMANFFVAGGATYCDQIAFHPYKSYSAPLGARLDFDRTLPALYLSQMTASGVAKPLANTECGSSTHTFNRLIENFAYSATKCNMSLVYSWDAVGYSDMRLQLKGINYWNDAVNFLKGKTMTALNSFGTGDFAIVLDGIGYLITGLGEKNSS